MKHAKTLRYALITALLAVSATVFAAGVEVKDAWVRGTVPGQKVTGAFMQITCAKDATLISASSPVAASVEVHEMKMEGDTMKMRAIEQLELPAGKVVALERGGYHIMLMGLKQSLKKDDVVPLTLKIRHADKKVESVKVKATVRDLTASNSSESHEHHH